ncbi:unnamed protein product [Allacma fusca]|uniref:Uncharacterized protein n=1 Tax=Allacma fusca TaxID=39272 RepID=A0A8J2PJD6_9HEXA|nr:unnamed protein product [Allacma fusca]
MVPLQRSSYLQENGQTFQLTTTEPVRSKPNKWYRDLFYRSYLYLRWKLALATATPKQRHRTTTRINNDLHNVYFINNTRPILGEPVYLPLLALNSMETQLSARPPA